MQGIQACRGLWFLARSSRRRVPPGGVAFLQRALQRGRIGNYYFHAAVVLLSGDPEPTRMLRTPGLVCKNHNHRG